MFTMNPEMSFRQRLALWWSGAWRRWLYSLPVCLGIFVASFAAWLVIELYMSRWFPDNDGLTQIAASMFIAMNLSCMPLLGYATRKAFAKHGFAVPLGYRPVQAAMLGLTTWGWNVTVWVLIGEALRLLQEDYPWPGPRLLLCGTAVGLLAYASLYIVLPRQARRLRIQAGGSRVMLDS